MTGLLTEPIVTNERLALQGIDAYPTSSSEVWGSVFDEQMVLNPATGMALTITPDLPADPKVLQQMSNLSGRPVEEIEAEIFAPMLTPEEANSRYGLEGQLSFDRPVTAKIAGRMRDLKREELRRQSVMSRGQGGAFEVAGSLGAGLAASLLDPINVASAFIPVVGEARYAMWAQRFGPTAARTFKGVSEGLVGAAVVEPLVLAQAARINADYDEMDSLLNIALGGALGGGLHVGVGWVGDRIAKRRLPAMQAVVEAAPQPVREAALRGAVAAVAEGRPVKSADLFDVVGQAVSEGDTRTSAEVLTAVARGDKKTGVDVVKAVTMGDKSTGQAAISAVAQGDKRLGAELQNIVAAADRELKEDILNLVSRGGPDQDKRLLELVKKRDAETVRAVFDAVKRGDKQTTADLINAVVSGDRKTGSAVLSAVAEGEKKTAADVISAVSRGDKQTGQDVIEAVRQADGLAARQRVVASAEDNQTYIPDEDRQIAAQTEQRVAPSMKATAEKQTADDAAAIQEEITELDRLIKSAGDNKVLTERDMESMNVANDNEAAVATRRAKGFRAAAACFLGLT